MKKKKRSIIPNILTMANMVMGFFAIIYATRGDAESIGIAALLVLGGSIFDALDGAAARALHVESPIGLQLDSLADGVSYGVAPGVISYQAFLMHLPEIGFGINMGMLVAPIFPICAIYRLARFNVETDEHKGFCGLPSPPAGIFIASIAALPVCPIMYFGKFNFVMPVEIFIVIYSFVAYLMISNFNYSKIFSDIYYKNKKLSIVVYIVLLIFFIFFSMWAVFTITLLYCLAGILRFVLDVFRHSK